MTSRRKSPDIGEIEIEGHQHAFLRTCLLPDSIIVCASEPLVMDMLNVMTCIAQQCLR